ncbi:MAG: sulfatase [Candidatus Sumerlaeia bacterium]|nr:sulfatase [Candidatus Sumerlaeia bacterium]
MDRRAFLTGMGAAAITLHGSASPAPRKKETLPPNFIVIFCDDLGYGDLGCYGATQIHTPRIDRMAAEGTRFTDFYAAAPLCTPSRAALLTGCYPRRVGLHQWVLRPNAVTGLHPDEITLAELLKTAGYRTGCIGKWHLGFLPPFRPTRQGFDYYFGLYHNLDDVETVYFKDVGGTPLLRNDAVVKRAPDPGELTELYTEEAVHFIRENRDRPFFLYLSHHTPHLPLGVSARFKGRSAAGLYGDVIECLDWSTGVILDLLQELRLDSRTLVVFTSDNGPVLKAGGSAGPLRGSKNTVFEGGLRVPGIIWGPSRVASARVCRQLATTMDLYPTFARMAGATLPADRTIDGRDIGPLLTPDPATAPPGSPHEAFFYHDGQGVLRAVRSGRWKLHLGPPPALYDLETDRAEKNNTADANGDVVGRLAKLAAEFDAELSRNARPVGRAEADPDWPSGRK